MIIQLTTATGHQTHLSVKRQYAEAVEVLAEIARQQRASNPHINRKSIVKLIAASQPVTEKTAEYYLIKLGY
jgi:hypothetical protein